jgi:hypothetical protein
MVAWGCAKECLLSRYGFTLGVMKMFWQFHSIVDILSVHF